MDSSSSSHLKYGPCPMRTDGLSNALNLMNNLERCPCLTPKFHMGKYTRDRVIAREAVNHIQNILGVELNIPNADNTGTAVLLNEVEESLYKLAKTYKITFINENFEKIIDSKSIESASHNKIQCDLIFDATGSTRAVLRAVNQTHVDNKPFTLEPMSTENPLPHHCYTATIMSADQNNLLWQKKISAGDRQEAINRLRNEFGWKEFIEPEWVASYKQTLTDGTIKQFLYFEVPEKMKEMTQDKQKEYLDLLLFIKTGNKDIQFIKFNGDKPFTPFDVNPHQTKTAYFSDSSTPMVIPIGDACIDPDYRLGKGIIFGISRLQALASSLRYTDENEPDIDLKKLVYFTNLEISKQHHIQSGDYDSKRMECLRVQIKHMQELECKYLESTSDIQKMQIAEHIAVVRKRISQLNEKQKKPSKKPPHTHDALVIELRSIRDSLILITGLEWKSAKSKSGEIITLTTKLNHGENIKVLINYLNPNNNIKYSHKDKNNEITFTIETSKLSQADIIETLNSWKKMSACMLEKCKLQESLTSSLVLK